MPKEGVDALMSHKICVKYASVRSAREGFPKLSFDITSTIYNHWPLAA